MVTFRKTCLALHGYFGQLLLNLIVHLLFFLLNMLLLFLKTSQFNSTCLLQSFRFLLYTGAILLRSVPDTLEFPFQATY